MSRIHIGDFDLGGHGIKVWGLPDHTGGYFTTNENGVMAIEVGLKYATWASVLNVFLHEAIEASCVLENARYQPGNDMANATDGYSFFFDHNQFSQIVARAAYLLAMAIPAVSEAFSKAKLARNKAAKAPRRSRKRPKLSKRV